MFTKSIKLTEAQKTQIIIDYLIDQYAQARLTRPDDLADLEIMIRVQRYKLRMLTKNCPF